MEGKFASEGLQAIDGDDDMLTAMARELVENRGIGDCKRMLTRSWPIATFVVCYSLKNRRKGQLSKGRARIPAILPLIIGSIPDADLVKGGNLPHGPLANRLSKHSCRCSDESIQAEVRTPLFRVDPDNQGDLHWLQHADSVVHRLANL